MKVSNVKIKAVLFVAGLVTMFAPEMASANMTCKTPKVDICYGHLGVKFKDNKQGLVNGIELFDDNCQKLTMASSSNFLITSILEQGDRMIEIGRWNMTRNDYINELVELGKLMDAAGVGYRPYEVYGGSDAGTAFEDVAAGEFGTAVNLGTDPLAHLKGKYAQATADKKAAILQSWNLVFVPGKYKNSLGRIGKAKNKAEALARLQAAYEAGTVQKPSCAK